MRRTQPVSSWLISSSLHVGALGVLLFAAAAVGPPPPLSPHVTTIPLRPRLPAPRLRPQESGGGQSMPEPASKGAPPKREHRMFLPPMVAVNESPRLVLAVSFSDAPEFDAGPIGDPSGLLGVPSGGLGCCAGLGDGFSDGIGDGKDSGFSGLQVSQEKLTRTPQVIYQVEPEYSEPARRAKIQGYVRLRIDVALDGRPTNIRVVQPIGMGLDENAIEAVKRWRFRPALIGDKPVVAPALVEVGFHLL
jgi:TonB family protein